MKCKRKRAGYCFSALKSSRERQTGSSFWPAPCSLLSLLHFFQYIAIGVLLVVFTILDVDALKLGGEAGELIDAFDEGAEVVDRSFCPDLAGMDAEDAGGDRGAHLPVRCVLRLQ